MILSARDNTFSQHSAESLKSFFNAESRVRGGRLGLCYLFYLKCDEHVVVV